MNERKRISGHERIRTALLELLRAVPGIGHVHAYERFSKTPQGFQALYQQGDVILGWYVHRQSWRELPFSSLQNRVRTRWVIQGFASLLDANETELAFDTLIDAVARAVRKRPVLFDAQENALCHTVQDDGAGLQLEESGPVMFAGVLCHAAKFSLGTEHMEEIEPDISDPTACPPSGKETKGCPDYRAAIAPKDVSAPAAELIRPFADKGDK